MHALSALPIDQRAKCLAIHRVKAKLIKDSFINEGSIDREQVVGRQVIRYSTLLSEKMLNKIKTEELREFEKEVQEYCRQTQRNIQKRRTKKSEIKELNLSQYLSNFKNSTKVRLISIHKKRTKTSQGYELSIKPARNISPDLQPQTKIRSPLGNKKIKDAIEQNKKKLLPANRFQISGKAVNSQIIHLLEKLDEVLSIEKLRKRRECLNEEEEEQIHGRTNMLKQEKERLTTALENQERPKFKPMGRIKKENKGSCDKTSRKMHQSENNKIFHSRANKVKILQPVKRSSIASINTCAGQASIQLQQGLPKSILNQISSKKGRKNQVFVTLDEEEHHQDNSENLTPPLLHSNNIFSNNYM